MYQIDIKKIRGKMGEKGYNNSSLSKALGINRNTLKDYFDHPNKIPYLVVSGMAIILCDSDDEAKSIFFAK